MNLDLKKLIAVFAALAALIVAGCGSDEDGDSDGGGEALSEEEYAVEVDEIFNSFAEASTTIGTELTEATSGDALQSGLDELAGRIQESVDDLNEIEPPEAATEAHGAITDAIEGYLGDIETVRGAIDTDDPAQLQEAILEFQQAATGFQTEFADGITQLQDAGIEPPSGE